MSVKQVLIFDSGVGGLSVFDQVRKQSPGIKCFYLFDNAYFPYGELQADFLIQRLMSLLSSFLGRHKIDLIVIACNSASTVALQYLRESFSIPIVGVVPAIKPATFLTKNGVIGLLATPATINGAYTARLIDEFAADKQVLKIGSTQLVKLAELKLQGKLIQQADIEGVLAAWLMLDTMPDTIVLGCTHFPLLKAEIFRCFKDKINLVDSGNAIAQRVTQLLGESEMTAKENTHQAYFTKVYQLDESTNFSALQRSFLAYGFNSLQLYI
ncbi:glutamate racemase [Psychromonas ingrahamii 37]|uniref:Glutamate racemase n=1 Tax=Psychromonas ingrahamii (strain DSM 17664 / CCUG 51855 / 37) TaxID=357804 RepID=A1SSL7_PSYIN|nr:glutamate racemase [Psychromonas ingrahamii]ABM02482.1 glutamate racemase [Psychromonas ingrahamii 37]